MDNTASETSRPREPWNKGKLVGQKAPFKLREIWAIRMRQKTSRPVQFEIAEQTRIAVADWMKMRNLHSEDYLFPSRVHGSPHLGTRQYARIVEGRVTHVGLDPCAYGTFHAAHKGRPHLQAHEKLARGAAFARSCQVGARGPPRVKANGWFGEIFGPAMQRTRKFGDTPSETAHASEIAHEDKDGELTYGAINGTITVLCQTLNNCWNRCVVSQQMCASMI